MPRNQAGEGGQWQRLYLARLTQVGQPGLEIRLQPHETVANGFFLPIPIKRSATIHGG